MSRDRGGGGGVAGRGLKEGGVESGQASPRLRLMHCDSHLEGFHFP